MIRCALPAGVTLEALVDQAVPKTARRGSWRTRAANHTVTMRSKKKLLLQGAPTWGEVKEVYVRLQSGKCGYCEKYLETSEIRASTNVGAVEQDVEHYRPKGAVKPWTSGATMGFPVRDGTPGGYYLLAFDLFNYCVACKTCNTAYKLDRFPIEGRPARKGSSVIGTINTAERPLLLYPISDLDDDPETCIGFVGYNPIAKAAAGRSQRRALATVRFFDLDTRENLIRQRCEIIVSLYNALMNSANPADARRQADGDRDVERLTSEKSHHANCARSYRAMFLADANRAYTLYQEAQQVLVSN